MRRFGLFVVMALVGGTAAIGGALAVMRLLGDALGHDPAFFGGGALVGFVAVLATAWASGPLRLVRPTRRVAVATGAAVGFVAAAVISVVTAITGIIPMVSFLLVGLGAVVGDAVAAEDERTVAAARVV